MYGSIAASPTSISWRSACPLPLHARRSVRVVGAGSTRFADWRVSSFGRVRMWTRPPKTPCSQAWRLSNRTDPPSPKSMSSYRRSPTQDPFRRTINPNLGGTYTTIRTRCALSKYTAPPIGRNARLARAPRRSHRAPPRTWRARCLRIRPSQQQPWEHDDVALSVQIATTPPTFLSLL